MLEVPLQERSGLLTVEVTAGDGVALARCMNNVAHPLARKDGNCALLSLAPHKETEMHLRVPPIVARAFSLERESAYPGRECSFFASKLCNRSSLACSDALMLVCQLLQFAFVHIMHGTGYHETQDRPMGCSSVFERCHILFASGKHA